MRKIAQWVIGVFVILMGITSLKDSAVAGIVWILSGLLIIPIITKTIPSFNGKKAVIPVCCICLFFIGALALPDTEQVNSGKEEIQETADYHEDTTNSLERNIDDKKELSTWLDQKLLDESAEVTDNEVKFWGKAEEKEFLSVWKKTVLEHLREKEDPSEIAGYVVNACDIYVKIYGTTNKISSIVDNSENMANCLKEQEAITGKYNFDFLWACNNLMNGKFYVSQRLSKSYSAGIMGKLQEAADSYNQTDDSDWVAYNVEYIFNEPVCGDECFVIHADIKDPFHKSGAYDIYYYDTGEQITLSDSSGFNEDVPIFHLVEDISGLEYDKENYSLLVEEYDCYYHDIEQELEDNE